MSISARGGMESDGENGEDEMIEAFPWLGLQVDQSVLMRNGRAVTTTVREIEMVDRGPTYGKSVVDGENWLVELRSPGCWRAVGPCDVMEREVLG